MAQTVVVLAAQELAAALSESIGEAVFEDATGLANPPPPRSSWIDLQHDVVALAPSLTHGEALEVGRALLRAILDQPSYGPSNRLDEDALRFLLCTLGDELETAIAPGAGHLYGGQRYLRQHLWLLPGEDGARWLRRLAMADDVGTNFLFQDMCAGKIPGWAAADWPARLDAIASLPPDPRPGIVTMLFLADIPRAASAALTRVALGHGVDERDPLVRVVAAHLRASRIGRSFEDVGLFDWDAGRRRPALFRWLLELAGEAGQRQRLVAAAVQATLIARHEAAFLGAPLDRPAWADSDVPWEIDETVAIGTVRLPSGRVTGGDPWWTGGAEGLPWVVPLGAHGVAVDVVVASHPLGGRQCAALVARVEQGDAVTWQRVPGTFEPEGYRVEVGVAGLGAVECYDSRCIFESALADRFPGTAPPAWHLVDAGPDGGIAMCTVGPQHQLCRTWVGRSGDGRVVALVTDLGLLDIDEATLPDLVG